MKKKPTNSNNNRLLNDNKRNGTKSFDIFKEFIEKYNNDKIDNKNNKNFNIKKYFDNILDAKNKPFDKNEKILMEKDEELKRIEELNQNELFLKIKNNLMKNEIHLKNGDETIKAMEILLKEKIKKK